ncbi:MAG: hypothetical protein JWO63_2306, partial [Frankiales bacterium]|nr:hypothetical protein [Frankiales bacterium]
MTQWGNDADSENGKDSPKPDGTQAGAEGVPPVDPWAPPAAPPPEPAPWATPPAGADPWAQPGAGYPPPPPPPPGPEYGQPQQ